MSPVYDRIKGYNFYFVLYDLREPPHVHVGEGNSKSASDAKIWLRDVSVATPGRFNEHQLGRILDLVEENQERWLEIWRQYAENQK